MYEQDYQQMLELIKQIDPLLIPFLPLTAPLKPPKRSHETIILSIVLSRRISFAVSRKIRAKLFSIVGEDWNGEALMSQQKTIQHQCGRGTWQIIESVVKNGFQFQGQWTTKAVKLMLAIQNDTYRSDPPHWLHLEDKWIQRNLHTIDAQCSDWQTRLTALAPFTNLFLWTMWREKCLLN